MPLGDAWEAVGAPPDLAKSLGTEWAPLLPAMDVWIEAEVTEVHHVCHLLPSLKWKGEAIGVRLRYEPKDLKALYADYLLARKASRDTVAAAVAAGVAKGEKGADVKVSLWPSNMQEFLGRRLRNYFRVRTYLLDPAMVLAPEKGYARPQTLPVDRVPVGGNPFERLIRVNEIQAQRGFSDSGTSTGGHDDSGDDRPQGGGQRLTGQLQKYYAKHIDPTEVPEPQDVEALDAIFQAEEVFNAKLRQGFDGPFTELETLGYPGVTNPKLRISTKLEPMDGLKHASSLQYDVISAGDSGGRPLPRLPEQYNGLGYQNLISMVFRLMSFRDAWMQVGKAEKTPEAEDAVHLPPLHIVLLEEPEAHLHAQVQQVFIHNAYAVLRKHADLGESKTLHTQLVVSTHSSHMVHECEFAALRYFRRIPAREKGENPTSVVVNMSEVFGTGRKTEQFVTRYMKATHCDLFFADAAIFVEGLAERILVPHFIRGHFEGLRPRYLTIMEIGGRYAHRFRPLIEHLGLTTLVITDLDSAKKANNGRLKKARTARGEGLVSSNTVIRKWLPNERNVDTLLDLGEAAKIEDADEFMSVRVAYQTPVEIAVPEGSTPAKVFPYTFEDSLVFENLEVFRDLSGLGMIKAFKKAIRKAANPDELAKLLFDILEDGGKGEFASNLIYAVEPTSLKAPGYIAEGLAWLEAKLRVQEREVNPKEATAGEEEKK